jgi:hypothetical protein
MSTGRHKRCVAALFPTVVAFGAAPAGAATVEVRSPATPGDGDETTLIAAPGENNDVVVSHPDATTVVISDRAATLNPGAFCTALDAHSVRCNARPGYMAALFAARVNTGDGNDRITAQREARIDVILRADAGSGDDVIEGGRGSDELDGGGGTDVVQGGGGGDHLTDGDTSAAAGPDVIDSGDTWGFVSYERRTRPVFVDLRRPGGQGERGEGDTLTGVRDVTGGSGDDYLRGDDGENRLVGGPGRDRLGGLGGRDRLEGGPRKDTFLCGRGPDVVYRPEPFDFLERDCEVVLVPGTYAGGYRASPRVGRRTLAFPNFYCPDNDGEHLDCVARVTVREATGRRRVLAAVTTRKRVGRGRDLRVPLTAAGRRAVRKRGGVIARVDAAGRFYPRGAWTIRVKR